MKDIATENEIARLERLLKFKADEYKLFGITPTDIENDNEIRQKISVLKKSVKLSK